jgi:small-conductance mechanosensitive channel
MSTTTTGRGHPRRTRRSPAEQQRLERLTAARDQLDAAAAERRRREDEALAGYAARAGEADEVIAARDVALADLDRQRQAVIDGAATKLADIDARKTAVLAVLNELGRSAEELSALFEIPVKKVRALLRTQRRSTSAPAEPAATSYNGPSGAPPGEPQDPQAGTSVPEQAAS